MCSSATRCPYITETDWIIGFSNFCSLILELCTGEFFQNLSYCNLQLLWRKIFMEQKADTHLHQQLSAEWVVIVIGEDLGQLAEGPETFPAEAHKDVSAWKERNILSNIQCVETYRDTSSQVLFRRWMALHCRAERMALREEKFFRIRHSWVQQWSSQKQTF